MSGCDLVTLQGLTVPRAALETVIDLELRGVILRVENGKILVPCGVLTDAERDAIKRWRWHVLALLEYAPPAPAWIQ